MQKAILCNNQVCLANVGEVRTGRLQTYHNSYGLSVHDDTERFDSTIYSQVVRCLIHPCNTRPDSHHYVVSQVRERLDAREIIMISGQCAVRNKGKGTFHPFIRFFPLNYS